MLTSLDIFWVCGCERKWPIVQVFLFPKKEYIRYIQMLYSELCTGDMWPSNMPQVSASSSVSSDAWAPYERAPHWRKKEPLDVLAWRHLDWTCEAVFYHIYHSPLVKMFIALAALPNHFLIQEVSKIQRMQGFIMIHHDSSPLWTPPAMSFSDRTPPAGSGIPGEPGQLQGVTRKCPPYPTRWFKAEEA